LKSTGWITDKFGVSWQVIPKQLMELVGNADRVKAKRASDAMFTMKKLIVADLQKAFDGE
jgi:predicted 3-demethylubiquinone-9 3-methyltransferase (glyoxalase superfamily)